MDRVARLLRGEVCNVEIDPRSGLGMARVFVIAHQKLARPEDVERRLIQGIVGPRPTVNLRGQGTERGARRKVFRARMRLENDGRGQHERGRNAKAKGPAIHAYLDSGLFQMNEITRCTAYSIDSATRKISHPPRAW